MAGKSVLGRFLWHDLITTDLKAAVAFYRKVVGWKTQSWEQDPNYTLWVAESGPIGGLRLLPETQRAAGAKPHWLAYIGTDNIQSTINQATELGGLIVVNATEIPNGGRYAILADPQGALFGVYSSAKATAPAFPQKRGEISWHELVTSDYAKAFEFYRQLFGWQKLREHDMGAIGVYLLFGLDGKEFGGMFNNPGDGPAAWGNYALVNDAEAAASTARTAGGQILHGPMEVPGGGWIAQISDPQGAYFAVHALQRAAGKPAQKPAPVAPKAEKPAAKKTPAAAKAVAQPKRAAAKKATKKAAKKVAKNTAKKTLKKSRPVTKKKAAKKKLVKKTAKKAVKKVTRRAVKKKSARRAKRPARKTARRR